jgi:hypothetical protein
LHAPSLTSADWARGSVRGQAGGAAPDRFGLLGLLGVIRMSDPDLTTLALGTDLTGLGLHLNSPENVYKTFASPWAEQPLRPEPEFKVWGWLALPSLEGFSSSDVELCMQPDGFCTREPASPSGTCSTDFRAL